MYRFVVKVRGMGCEGLGFGFCDGADDVSTAERNGGEWEREEGYAILLLRDKKWTPR